VGYQACPQQTCAGGKATVTGKKWRPVFSPSHTVATRQSWEEHPGLPVLAFYIIATSFSWKLNGETKVSIFVGDAMATEVMDQEMHDPEFGRSLPELPRLFLPFQR
jgi:hypothetical protein